MSIDSTILKVVDALNNVAQAGFSLASAVDRLCDSKAAPQHQVDDLTGVTAAPIAELEAALEVEEAPTPVTEDPETEDPVTEDPVTAATETAPVATEVDFDSVRETVIWATQTRGREFMVETLGQFGVSNIKDLKEDQYADLVAMCKA